MISPTDILWKSRTCRQSYGITFKSMNEPKPGLQGRLHGRDFITQKAIHTFTKREYWFWPVFFKNHDYFGMCQNWCPQPLKKDRLNRFDPRIWRKNHMDLSMVNFWCGLAAEFKHKSPSHAAWILPICPKPPPKVTDCVMPGASKRRGRIGFFRFDNSSNTIGYSIHLASNSEKIKTCSLQPGASLNA